MRANLSENFTELLENLFLDFEQPLFESKLISTLAFASHRRDVSKNPTLGGGQAISSHSPKRPRPQPPTNSACCRVRVAALGPIYRPAVSGGYAGRVSQNGERHWAVGLVVAWWRHHEVSIPIAAVGDAGWYLGWQPRAKAAAAACIIET
jgi:hypothetical protein